MKKLNYLLLGLAGLTLASCSNDDLQAPADGTYQLTVNLPKDMATRAIGDQITVDQTLSYTVFTYDGTYVTGGTQAFGTGQTSTTLNLPLLKGNGYKIAFFSQSTSSASVYTYNNGNVSVDYEAMTYGTNVNADAYDCFSGKYEIEKVEGSLSETITLTRPVAQINWGTNDLTSAAVIQAFGEGTPDLETTFSATVPSTLNILSEEYGTAGNVTFPATGLPSTDEAFPVEGYSYLAMQYVLAPANMTSDLTLSVTGQTTSADPIVITVNAAPLQTNYRTNIYGGLLTDQANFNVTLSSEWGGTDYDLPQDAQSLIDALENGGNVVLGSDIYLPTFPTITKTTTLDLNGHTLYYDFTLPNERDDHMIVVNGGDLTITGNGKIADNIPYGQDNKNTLVFVSNGGTVTIENGDFSASGAGQLIYVEEGTANINGGSFKLTDDYSKDNWCINCKDGSYNSTSFVNVKGGMFYEWNPADTNTEGTPRVSYLAPGYQSIATTIDGATWYVVVPQAAAGETTEVVTNTDDLASAINSASGNITIYVTPATTVKLPSSASNKTFTVKGLDQETTVIDAQNAYWTYNSSNITLENLTVETFINTTNHTSMGFKGATSQSYTNVIFDGEFHVFSGNADFTDCTFNYVAASGTNYQLWCETSGTVNVTNCTMNCNDGKAILVYGEAAGATGGDVNVDGLTVTSIGNYNDKGVVEIHSENYIKAQTITIKNVNYPTSYFKSGLWREINNEKKSPNYEKPTHYYTIYVNGVEEQVGDETGPQPIDN